MSNGNFDLKPEATLQQIITANRPALQLLKSIGLNVAGESDKTLRQVCAEKKWSEHEVLNWIKKNDTTQIQQPTGSKLFMKVSKRKIPFICDSLSASTYPFLKKHISEIQQNYPRISRVHGTQYLWLREAEWPVHMLSEKLPLYLRFEKNKFFPLAKELHFQKHRILDGNVQNLLRSVKVIEEDHQHLLDLMSAIRRISQNFSFDESACSSLRILCKQIKDLFVKLDEHIKIEQQVLLPQIRKTLGEI